MFGLFAEIQVGEVVGILLIILLVLMIIYFLRRA